MGSDAYPMEGHAGIYENYSAIIPYPATDTELRVAFERGPNDVSAPGSTVIVPALFAIAPPSRTQYSRATDTLEIDWAPFESNPARVVVGLRGVRGGARRGQCGGCRSGRDSSGNADEAAAARAG